MIKYLGRELTPNEELVYLNAVLDSYIRLQQQYIMTLAKGPEEDSVLAWSAFWERVRLIHLVADAEWERWVRLYDEGQKFAWSVLPMAIPDIYNQG